MCSNANNGTGDTVTCSVSKLDPTEDVEIHTLNDNTTEKTLNFSNSNNETIYFKIPRHSYLFRADLNLSKDMLSYMIPVNVTAGDRDLENVLVEYELNFTEIFNELNCTNCTLNNDSIMVIEKMSHIRTLSDGDYEKNLSFIEQNGLSVTEYLSILIGKTITDTRIDLTRINSLEHNWTEIDVEFEEENLDTFIFHWNGTDHIFKPSITSETGIYNLDYPSLVLAMNFNNMSDVGENYASPSTGQTVYDYSHYGNNGTTQGGIIYNSTGGKYGGALSFDGSNDKVTINNNNNQLYNTNFTILAWVNYRALATNNYYDHVILAQDIGSYSNNKWMFGINTLTTGTHFEYYNTVAGGGSRELNGNAWTMSLGTWYYLGITKNGSNFTFFRNGAADGSVIDTTPIPSITTVPITFAWSENLYFNGSIDEVRIYNRSLTAEEISMHYYSNLQKYNTTHWNFHTNLTNLNRNLIYNYSSWWNSTANPNGTLTSGVINAPSNVALDIGNDSNIEWLHGEVLTDTVTIHSQNLTSELNDILNNNCNCNGCSIHGGNCRIPLRFRSDSEGRLRISNIDLTYSPIDEVEVPGVYHNGKVKWHMGGRTPANTIREFNIYFDTENKCYINNHTIVDVDYTLLTCPESSHEPNWWNHSWIHRTPITIDNSNNTETLHDYQISVNPKIYNNDGLVLSMHFSEGNGTYIKDSSGRNNDGILNVGNGDNASSKWVDGRFGKALHFDGSNDYVTGSLSSTLTGNMTAEVWFKGPNQSDQRRILDIAQATTTGLQICLSSTGQVMIDNSGGPSNNIISSAIYGDNRWHSATGVRIGTDYYLYVDGEYIGTSSGNPSPTYTRFFIGQRYLSSNFNGSIDEVRIYNRSLTPQEIREHYEASKARLDYQDLRFIYYNISDVSHENGTEIPYWFENDRSVWVKVPEIPAESTERIWMYHGNNNATSSSNPDSTFILYDDFLGNTLDESKWRNAGNAGVGSATVSNGVLTITAGGVGSRAVGQRINLSMSLQAKFRQQFTGSRTHYEAHVFGFSRMNQVNAFAAWWTSLGCRGHCFELAQEAAVYQYKSCDDGYCESTRGLYIAINQTNMTGGGNTEPDQNWHVYLLSYYAGDLKLYQDGVLWQNLTTISAIPTMPMGVMFGEYNDWSTHNAYNNIDWVFVAKHTIPEPVVTVGIPPCISVGESERGDYVLSGSVWGVQFVQKSIKKFLPFFSYYSNLPLKS